MKNKRQALRGINLNSHRLSYLIDKEISTILCENDFSITNSQYLVLKAVYLLDQPTQREISDFLKISEAAVSRHINNLLKTKLVKIENIGSRSHMICLTPHGEEKFIIILRLINKKLKKIIPNYPKLSDMLMRAVDNIK